MRCWWRHQWGPWEVKILQWRLVAGLLTYKEELDTDYTEAWQERRCLRCRKIQRERL